MLTLTREDWKAFAPGCPAAWTEALFARLDLLRKAGLLDNERRWAHFAATVYHETGDFSALRESLSYSSAKRLREVWPSRFRNKSDEELRPLLRNPIALGDCVYGGRMGNDQPGDGYAYRGGGWIQTTGKEAVRTYCAALGYEGPVSGDLLDDPGLTLEMAVVEWTRADCNRWADANDLRAVAKAINTGSADSNIEPVGMDSRKKAFARAWKIWGEYGAPEVPAEGMSKMEKIGLMAGLGGTGLTVANNVAPLVPSPQPVIEALGNLRQWEQIAAGVITFGSSASGFAVLVGLAVYGGVVVLVPRLRGK